MEEKKINGEEEEKIGRNSTSMAGQGEQKEATTKHLSFSLCLLKHKGDNAMDMDEEGGKVWM